MEEQEKKELKWTFEEVVFEDFSLDPNDNEELKLFAYCGTAYCRGGTKGG